MHKKSIFFGVGIGVLAMVLISFGAYAFQRASFTRDIYDLRAEAEGLEAVIETLEAALEAALEEARQNFEQFALGGNGDDDEQGDEDEDNDEDGDEDEEDNDEDEDEDNLALEPPNPPQQPEAPEPPQQQVAPTQPASPEGFTLVYIPVNAFSTQIAQILAEAGVVSSANEFAAFLVDNHFDTRLMAGNWLLPINGDFNDIVQRILAGT